MQQPRRHCCVRSTTPPPRFSRFIRERVTRAHRQKTGAPPQRGGRAPCCSLPEKSAISDKSLAAADSAKLLLGKHRRKGDQCPGTVSSKSQFFVGRSSRRYRNPA